MEETIENDERIEDEEDTEEEAVEEYTNYSESDDEVEVENDAKKLQSPLNRALTSALHEEYVAPLSFLLDAADKSFIIPKKTRRPFGKNGEAYMRPCYAKIFNLILEKRKEFYGNRRRSGLTKRKTLFVIRGSSGIGKSTFTSYLIGKTRSIPCFKNFAILYSRKMFKETTNGQPNLSSVHCCVMMGGKRDVDGRFIGEKVIDGAFVEVRKELVKLLPEIGLILMDGCVTPLDLSLFKGVLIVAASPGLSLNNIMDEIVDQCIVTMPALDLWEAYEIADMLGVERTVVKDNWRYMEGITRFLFEKDRAKNKVKRSLTKVNTKSITRMVSMHELAQKGKNHLMAHSLVLWIANTEDYTKDPSFKLVSRHVEKEVAKKLCKESINKLKKASKELAQLSGAEGYAGTLFEALAIKMILSGCNLSLRSLEDGTSTRNVIVPPIENTVTMECNDLFTVHHDEVRLVGEEDDEYLPCLLWPSTTNFPTFDCIYFHTTGEVFLLQMTIAEDHGLKNSGADNAKKYFDGMEKVKRYHDSTKYTVVFVVPKHMAKKYKKQKFIGTISKKKKANLEPYFDQWVVGI